MTSTVIPLTHYVDKSLIARMFVKFKWRYGPLWTQRASCDEDWESIIDEWFDELACFTPEQVRSAIKKTITTNPEYPPTLGQLVNLCIKESGMPHVDDVIQLMISRVFSHPLVKMVYDKIGSWTLTTGKEEDIARKAKEYYTACLAEFQAKPQVYWASLESFNAKPKELPPPDKILTPEERISFRERMSEYQKKLEEAKVDCAGMTYKEFDASKVLVGGRDFDQRIYDEYRAYLISIPETQTMILPVKYIYARSRFLSMIDQPEHLRKAGYNPNPKSDYSEPPRRNRPTQAYKSWVG